MAARETEIKFAIADLAGLRERLLELGFREVTERTAESNTLYDFADGRLRARRELIRLRKYGERSLLTHKGAPLANALHKEREETEASVEDGEAMDAILRATGLAPTFVYEKFRSEWSDGAGQVVLDETPIGDFGEIEGEAEWIERTAAALRVRREEYITASYAALFEEWKARTGSGAREMTWAAVRGKATAEDAEDAEA